MEDREYIQCPYCHSPNVKSLDGTDKIGKDNTFEICPEMYFCSDCKKTFRLDENAEMQLEITEIAWGINRMTGKKSERESGREIFPCKIGDLPQVGLSSRRFSIDKINAKSIVLTVRTNADKYNRTWTVKKGQSIIYRPTSYDGGHYYEIKLK